VTRDLARAFPDNPDHLRELHDRLAAAALQDGVLDVAYRTLDTPVGTLLLAATEQGLVRVAYAPAACATNPLPVVVPCHRVVRPDCGIGGYLGGIEAKRTLLTLAAAA
jgi:hypothetical protein